MTIADIVTLVNNLGVPIVIIGFVGWATIKVAVFGKEVTTNHLVHLQAALDSMVVKLDKLIEIAERNSPKQ